jgi:hypothetical protein
MAIFQNFVKTRDLASYRIELWGKKKRIGLRGGLPVRR